MKILITNEAKLTETIAAAEGKAKVRTITANDIRNTLEKIKVPKSKLNGTKVHYDGAEHFPRAYKYRPESTHWEAENIKGKWYVTNIFRSTCPNRSTWNAFITYGEEAKAWILDNARYM